MNTLARVLGPLAALLVAAAELPAQQPVQPIRRELAGKPLGQFPWFQFTRSVNEGETVRIAFDPRTDVGLSKRSANVYVIDHAKLGQALAGKKLDGLGSPFTVHLLPGGVKENTFLLDGGTLDSSGHADANGTWLVGHGYDVIADMDQDGVLDASDLLDGSPEEAGFHVVEPFAVLERGLESGPYAVTELLYNGGRLLRQDIYYPTDIAALGALPLIVISHGNGHNYQWYDHLGYHMASHGYVVMSHENNTGPGIETASTTTLRNTEAFVNRLDTIGEGVLLGHVDTHRIVWVGHSRGGEGVVYAYRRLSQTPTLVTGYTLDDIRLVSSIAPTDFLGPSLSNMGATPYHLWTGGADADVNGCADCDICQTFHLLDRADGDRYSISLHGVGHGDFHANEASSSVAAGPCQVGRSRTHIIMRGYFLPLVQWVLDGNPACLDYLTRQWEEFRALGMPDITVGTGRCMIADLMFHPGPARSAVVIDDFQSRPALTLSSSGGQVQHSPGLDGVLIEGRLDDANANFTGTLVDPMNGMTQGGPGDTTAGAVLQWNGTNEWLLFEVPAGKRDLRGLRTLSFRAAQVTRDALTIVERPVDLDFAVELTDGARRASVIEIGAYGGGIEEPYGRSGCGTGSGWANEFETIRIPLAAFRANGQPLDLADVVAIRFLFGPASGSAAGRIGLDDVEFTRE